MHINFTPERKRKFGKINTYPMLVIDNDVMEYSYIKSHTIISVYAHVNELTHYRYDKKSKLLELGGKFSISSRNIKTTNESIMNYNDREYALCFKYDFLNLEQFLSMTKAEKHTTIPKGMGLIVL